MGELANPRVAQASNEPECEHEARTEPDADLRPLDTSARSDRRDVSRSRRRHRPLKRAAIADAIRLAERPGTSLQEHAEGGLLAKSELSIGACANAADALSARTATPAAATSVILRVIVLLLCSCRQVRRRWRNAPRRTRPASRRR